MRARFWKPLIARAGVKDIRFHDLRHTAATLMLAANVPVMVVSKRMGHASPDYTLRLYGHVLPMLQRDVATRVERFIETARATA